MQCMPNEILNAPAVNRLAVKFQSNQISESVKYFEWVSGSFKGSTPESTRQTSLVKR